jgi:hypothetical protein
MILSPSGKLHNSHAFLLRIPCCSRSGAAIFGLLMVLQREYNRGDNMRRRGPETWVLEAVSPMGIAS